MEKAFTIKTLTAPLAAAALALALAAPLSALEDPRYFSSKAAGTTTADFLNRSEERRGGEEFGVRC